MTPKRYPGRFIVLEGSEGTGKTTQIERLARHLADAGREVVVTREPGGTLLGEKLRGILLDTDQQLTPETELLLMFAARAEHVARVIEPALLSGKWVISDRFVDASYAYQGGGRGIPQERVGELENWLLGEFRADLVLILDLPAEEGLRRVVRRGEKDRFEQEAAIFFERVRKAYRERANLAPDRIKIVDARGAQHQVFARLIRAVSALE